MCGRACDGGNMAEIPFFGFSVDCLSSVAKEKSLVDRFIDRGIFV
jgi:hypothetical protein